MNCGFDVKLVSMYADGELGRDRGVQVETHISGCEECSTILHDIRQFGKTLRSVPRKVAPQGLVGRILERAGANVRRVAWDAVKWTAFAVWKVAVQGCAVDDELAHLLRTKSPPWVARWVLYV